MLSNSPEFLLASYAPKKLGAVEVATGKAEKYKLLARTPTIAEEEQ